jgi:hypothetical protein
MEKEDVVGIHYQAMTGEDIRLIRISMCHSEKLSA